MDGQPIADSPDVASALRRVGFADGYRGLVLRGRLGTARSPQGSRYFRARAA